MEVLDRYFDAIRKHDWDALSATLSANVHRTGPYLDEVRGREAYVAFLSRVVPSLPNYALDVAQVHRTEDGGALVLLSETLHVKGKPVTYPEALMFGFDSAGAIDRVDIYIKQPPG